MKSRTPFNIDVTRGNAVESTHQVMVCVSDARGIPQAYWGNIDYITFPRSSMKPLQAIPFVESGAMEKFGLDERMLAMACASHMGEKMHMEVLTQWLEKIKITESDLHCGPCYPGNEAAAHEMMKKGAKPTSLLHNCSGKHLGIISTCLALGEDHKDYWKPTHPAQARIRKALAEHTKVKIDNMPAGTDGCAIPAYSMPLQSLALGMSTFFNTGIPKARAQTLQRIFHAWKNNPKLVSGTENFSANLSEKTKGRCMLKSGAEGAFVGLMPEKQLVFALKVADGAKRAAEVASALVFKHFGALTEAEYQELKQWTMPSVKNSRGEDVGVIKLGTPGA
jgi:L-asparaginase II